jgi:hypothetical protein
MVTSVAQVDEIELVLKTSGTSTVKVNRAEYEAAKADGSLPWFLDVHLSNVELDSTVTEPDGSTYNPYWMVD